MNRETLLANIREWQQRVGDASAKWGGAEICAVSKTVDAGTSQKTALQASLRNLQ